MSPFVHALIAWIIAVMMLAHTRDRRLAVILGAFSDIDGFFILYDRVLYNQYHHTLGHSYLLAIPLALVLTFGLARDKKKTFAASMLAFTLHLVADVVGSNWLVQPFYPLSTTTLLAESPFSHHLVFGIINPVTLVLVLAVTAAIMYFREASPFEFLSVKLDRLVVGVLVYPLKYRCEACAGRALGQCNRCGQKVCRHHLSQTQGLSLICSGCGNSAGS